MNPTGLTRHEKLEWCERLALPIITRMYLRYRIDTSGAVGIAPTVAFTYTKYHSKLLTQIRTITDSGSLVLRVHLHD